MKTNEEIENQTLVAENSEKDENLEEFSINNHHAYILREQNLLKKS